MKDNSRVHCNLYDDLIIICHIMKYNHVIKQFVIQLPTHLSIYTYLSMLNNLGYYSTDNFVADQNIDYFISQ